MSRAVRTEDPEGDPAICLCLCDTACRRMAATLTATVWTPGRQQPKRASSLSVFWRPRVLVTRHQKFPSSVDLAEIASPIPLTRYSAMVSKQFRRFCQLTPERRRWQTVRQLHFAAACKEDDGAIGRGKSLPQFRGTSTRNSGCPRTPTCDRIGSTSPASYTLVTQGKSSYRTNVAKLRTSP